MAPHWDDKASVWVVPMPDGSTQFVRTIDEAARLILGIGGSTQ